jgi:hypothetical protein
MQKITLDTNCLLDVAESRPSMPEVLELVRAHEAKLVELALVASSASEKMVNGKYAESFNDFEVRRNELGLGSVNLLFPLARWDFSFFDTCVWASDETAALEEEIFSVLFPAQTYEWKDTAKRLGLEVEDVVSPGYAKWRNNIIDAQMFWTHVWNKGDIFVTRDKNFKKKLSSSRFAEWRVMTPSEASTFIRR